VAAPDLERSVPSPDATAAGDGHADPANANSDRPAIEGAVDYRTLVDLLIA